MTDSSLTELRSRLARLEDEQAIIATLYDYGYALDYGDRLLFLRCFMANAEYVVELRVRPQANFRLDGHDALAQYFEDHTHAPTLYHKHLTTNPRVTWEGEMPAATSYFLRVDLGADGGTNLLTWGRYVDKFERDQGGRWRIRSRRAEVENR